MKLDRVIAVRNDKTVFRDGDRCTKVFNGEYSKADVLNEALTQARLEETALNIPKILEVTTFNGKWAIVSEYIKGKTLARLIDETPEKKKDYISLFADMHIGIHRNAVPLLTKLKDKMIRKIADTDLDATTRYDLHTRLEAMPKHNNVCHGDFNPSNVIISDDGTPYILDWSHASQGDALADAARTYLLFWMNGDITGAGLYLDIFCEKSGTEKEHVKRWMPLVSAAQLNGCHENEREFLMSWIVDDDSKQL